MRILFDQNMPRNLRAFLPGHEVRTSGQMGWQELENGELLTKAESAGFEVFITGDQNLSYQQNLSTRTISIIELTKNNWPSVEPHVERIAKAVSDCTPGSYQVIDCPYVFRARTRLGPGSVGQ
jgi:predicted nuclease of predicted toxin-antitoxin system